MEISIWQAGFLLMLTVVLYLFFRSLKFGKRFYERQEQRKQHRLEVKRQMVSEEVARKALSIAIAKSEVKKS